MLIGCLHVWSLYISLCVFGFPPDTVVFFQQSKNRICLIGLRHMYKCVCDLLFLIEGSKAEEAGGQEYTRTGRGGEKKTD